MFKWTHFHEQDRRSYTLITSCKRSAAWGVETWHAASLLLNRVISYYFSYNENIV